MMSSKNKGFTASDMERYHSGQMSPQERHALEKAALDDPFLADALEGYAYTNTPSSDLTKIQSRLDERQNRKKTAPFFQKYKWLGAAAIVLIMAGAGWFTYKNVSKGNAPSSIAQKKNEEASSPQPITNHFPVPDSNTFSGSGARSKNDGVAGHEKQNASQSNENNSDNIVRQSAEKANASSLSKKPAVRKKAKKVFLTARTVPATPNEMANADNSITQLHETSLSKSYGLPSTISRRAAGKNSSKDSGLTTAAPVLVHAADTIRNFNVALKPLPMDSSQIVVVGHGAKANSDVRYRSVTKPSQVIIDTLEPVDGYADFDDYVVNNLKRPEEFNDKPISGEVQLSFTVDTGGQPTNITVIKSLCEKCDEEAIRLLKEGPKWKKKKNQKGRIAIKF